MPAAKKSSSKKSSAKKPAAAAKKAAAQPKAKAAPKAAGRGAGTRDDPWKLQTANGGSEYTMYRDEAADPPALVCQVGSTTLRYHLRAIDDLHAMLKLHGDWLPLGAIVEVGRVVEAERGVPGVELLRGFEEAHDLAVRSGIRRHPIPGFGREGWRAGLDERVETPGHGAIRFVQRGDGRKRGAFPFR